MKLKEYLSKHSIRYRPFAKDLGIAEQTLRSIMAGIRRPGLVLALKIEELTKGEITPQQLVAQDFQKVSEEKARKKSAKTDKKCPNCGAKIV